MATHFTRPKKSKCRRKRRNAKRFLRNPEIKRRQSLRLPNNKSSFFYHQAAVSASRSRLRRGWVLILQTGRFLQNDAILISLKSMRLSFQKPERRTEMIKSNWSRWRSPSGSLGPIPRRLRRKKRNFHWYPAACCGVIHYQEFIRNNFPLNNIFA